MRFLKKIDTLNNKLNYKLNNSLIRVGGFTCSDLSSFFLVKNCLPTSSILKSSITNNSSSRGATANNTSIFRLLFPLPYTMFLFKILKYLILFLILINILLLIYDIYSQCYISECICHVIPAGDKNDSVPMDPVRWWPSGVPQGWTIVGTALVTFGALSRLPGVSPRARVLGALASAGVSASQITYQSAIENPVGFNRLMWGLSEYRRTGIWPSIEEASKSNNEKQVNDFASEAIKHADNSKVESIVSEVRGQKFLPSSNSDNSDLMNEFIDLIFKETMQVLKPVQVQGFLDDLIGQRMINKFDNKFITFYVKYQAFLSRITLFYIPIFILIGLFTICHGLHWLVTNQIPYESLEIDLHKFISSSIVLALTLSYNKIKLGLETVAYATNGDEIAAVKPEQKGIFKKHGYKGIPGIGLISFIKNKLPDWFKYIIILIISFISLNYFLKDHGLVFGGGSFNIYLILNNLIFVKLFLGIGSISSVIIVFYYLFNIYFYIVFSFNKIKIPSYLPQFILDWLNFIEKMSQIKDEGLYIKFYIRLIIVYLLIFLMCISMLIKLVVV